MKTALSFRLLLGRLLTRSGDQAWDFAVPLVLLKILPDQLRIAALYYLIIRFASVVLLPRLAGYIDHVDRYRAAKIGLLLQLVGVFVGTASVYFLGSLNVMEPSYIKVSFYIVFTFLTIGGILGSLGATFMDIAIANDLVPSIFHGEELAKFNSRFRQVDLSTEVGAPILAGLLLVLTSQAMPLLGFMLVALWNLFSFFPEFGLLKSIFQERPDLRVKPIHISEATKRTFLEKLRVGWKAFFHERVVLSMIAYAVLWLSVLSPHGVLLTAFLQDGWNMPEWIIGVFRGSGAVFGLLATLLFPLILKVLSLKRTSQLFLGFQMVMVLAGCILFTFDYYFGQIGFLVMVLFSRVGLYGFSLGEMQIRQEGIASEVRGQVNGFANALTGLATLLLFGMGALLPKTEDFKYLVFVSTGCVFLAFVLFTIWINRDLKKSEALPNA